jgi:four helix bundle protein
MSSTDFRKLVVWQRSKDLAVDIYKITKSGEISKDYGFTDQMRRAAVSIPSNIAEGNDRGSQKEFIRYLHIAKGSLSELKTQLEIAKEINYIEVEIFSDIESKCEELSKMLGGFIKSIDNKQ